MKTYHIPFSFVINGKAGSSSGYGSYEVTVDRLTGDLLRELERRAARAKQQEYLATGVLDFPDVAIVVLTPFELAAPTTRPGTEEQG